MMNDTLTSDPLNDQHTCSPDHQTAEPIPVTCDPSSDPRTPAGKPRIDWRLSGFIKTETMAIDSRLDTIPPYDWTNRISHWFYWQIRWNELETVTLETQ